MAPRILSLGLFALGACAEEFTDQSALMQATTKVHDHDSAAPTKAKQVYLKEWENDYNSAEWSIVGKDFSKKVDEEWISPKAISRKQVNHLKNRRLKQLWENCGPTNAKTRFHAQSWEDVMFLSHYFCNVKEGIYTEMGALDGKFLSTTKFFQDSMNWTGMLVEAQPENAKNLAINRPNNHIMPMAACEKGQKTLTFVGEAGHGVGGGIDTMDAKHVDQWGLKKANTYEVPCKPVGDMLLETKLPYLDFYVLDVEGAELAVLKTMNWDVPVCVWMVELDGKNPEKDEGVRQLLFSKGYKKSTWDFNAMCRSIHHHEPDCSMGKGGNEYFEHAHLDKCGTRGKMIL